MRTSSEKERKKKKKTNAVINTRNDCPLEMNEISSFSPLIKWIQFFIVFNT